MIPSYLYHYTTLETLQIILKNENVRFKRIDLMNDPYEGHLDSYKNSKKYVFSSSWTAQPLDEIPMWKMYNGLKGVRLRMPVDLFSFGKNMTVAKMSRSNNFLIKSKLNKDYSIELEEPMEFKSQKIKEFNINSVYGPTEINYVNSVEKILEDIISKNPSVKNFDLFEINLNLIGQKKINFWSFEKEFRFRVFLQNSVMMAGSDSVLRDTLDNHKIKTEYIDINFTKKSLDNVEILLGPKAVNKDKLTIEKILVEKGIKNYIIKKSNIKIQ